MKPCPMANHGVCIVNGGFPGCRHRRNLGAIDNARGGTPRNKPVRQKWKINRASSMKSKTCSAAMRLESAGALRSGGEAGRSAAVVAEGLGEASPGEG
jgi:hypothetical protein